MKKTVAELAELIDANIEGRADAFLTGAASVDDARCGDIVFAGDARYFGKAIESDAACVVAAPGVGESVDGKCVLRVKNPESAFAKILQIFAPDEYTPPVGIGPGAVIDESARMGENVSIGANCFIGPDAIIGDGCVLFPNVFIGDGVKIGANTKIYSGVAIYSRCSVGKNAILHAGVVIGADGFGYTPGERGLVKFPHTGTVEIGDDVEIGANSAVDRAKTGATVIGNGTKIDNLVHIAHNVKIGSHCVIVALSGIAGSVEIGNGVTLAAQTGVKDHVRIGDGCIVAARAGVIGDLDDGSIVSGFPARDHSVEKRVQAARLHLPEILRRLRSLENELSELRDATKEHER